MPARTTKSRWNGWHEPDAPADPTQELIDTPEPDPWTHVEPLFPMNGLPFTPTSPCPHHCKRCGGSGVFRQCGLCEGTGEFRVLATGEFFAVCLDCVGTGRGETPVECRDCEGTGKGPIPEGSPFICMCCDKGGKDGGKALPKGVQPLPLDLDPPAETDTPNRKKRRAAMAQGA